MKKRIITALVAIMMALTACTQAPNDQTENPEDTKTWPEISHEERIAILDDTKLPLPSKYYNQELREAYLAQLEIINEEYYTPGVVEDAEFWKFKELRDKLVEDREDYPTLRIEAPRIDRNNYRDAVVTIIDGDSSITKDIIIKIRGNSTASGEKKPYNIKFEEAISLFGLEEGKKWSLLANLYDKTLLRNKLALDFGRAMGLNFTSECEFVEVWLNDEYLGNYLLCEPISDGKNRVGVDSTAFEAIFEMAPGGDWNYETGTGVKLYYDSPEEPTNEQREYFENFFDEMEAALETHDMEKYSEYIDVDSFVNFYILVELFKDVDAYNKSTFIYIKNGKLYAGPPWDFDLTCGNVSTEFEGENYYQYHNVRGYGDDSGDSTRGFMLDTIWFGTLLDDPEFSALVVERYKELQPMILSLYEGEDCLINKLIKANYVSFEREFRASTPKNYGAGWSISKNYSPYSGDSKGDYFDNVEYLREWLRDRNAWLLENLGK